MGEKKIRAAIYARVSTTDQDPEPQLKALREYVNHRGFILHKEYVDRVTGDFSKRKKKRKQPDVAYQELMADVNKRLVDCVIVWKFDRFARSLNILVTALQHFNSLGVDFISYTQTIDTTTAMGRFFYNVIGAFAEFEKEMIVERVNAGLANARAKGVRLGRPVKDQTAGRRITALRQEGWSLRKIAEREKLSPAGVLKILRRNETEPAPLVDERAVESKDEISVTSLIPEICQLKILLFIVKPQVWRRILVPSDVTLAKLSDLIQISFGWSGHYSHMFVPTDARGCGVTLECDESTFRFRDLGFKPGDKMLYEYGGLDSWTHDIIFEKNILFDKAAQYPICTAGRMTSPPEICGGPMGFMEAKEYMHGRKIKGTGRVYAFDQEFCEEISKRGGFDAFDVEDVNRQFVGGTEPSVEPAKSGKPVLKANKTPQAEIYQFKLTILEVSPQIWRRVQIRSDSTLGDLSNVINAAFDWSGDHLHRFSWGDEMGENKQLSDLGLKPADSIMYEYDFGDLWEHEIMFEKTVRFDKKRDYPICTGGQNAGPPEDCGGPYAYMNARNFLSRRKGKKARAPRGRVSAFDKEFYRENYRSFDPDSFDRAEINTRLHNLNAED